MSLSEKTNPAFELRVAVAGPGPVVLAGRARRQLSEVEVVRRKVGGDLRFAANIHLERALEVGFAEGDLEILGCELLGSTVEGAPDCEGLVR